MNVRFNTTWLAPGGEQAARNVRVNGRQITDDAAFFQSAEMAFYPRGNLAVELAFVTQWQLNTAADAEVFALTHPTYLPLTPSDLGVLTCFCGAGTGTTPTQRAYMDNCVLESARIIAVRGLAVDVEYVVRGPKFQTDTPPDLPSCSDPDDLVLVYRRASVSIPNGATSVAVTFDSPMSGTPVVVAVVAGVSASVALFCRVLSDTVTSSGFTAELSAAAPDGSYTLNYWAVQ